MKVTIELPKFKRTIPSLMDLYEEVNEIQIKAVKSSLKKVVLKEVKKLDKNSQVKFWAHTYYNQGDETVTSIEKALKQVGLRKTKENVRIFCRLVFLIDWHSKSQ